MVIYFPCKTGSIIIYKGEFYKPGHLIVSVWFKGKNVMEFSI